MKFSRRVLGATDQRSSPVPLGNTFIASGSPAEDISTHRTMRMNESLHAFDFERQFDDRAALEWFERNWGAAFVLSGVYVLVIVLGRVFMKDRQKLELRKPLVLWSLCLATFSIMGAMRTGWYMFSLVRSRGLRESVCDTGFFSASVSKFWAFAFTLSKAPELGKTFTLTADSLTALVNIAHKTSIIPLFFSEKKNGTIFTQKLQHFTNSYKEMCPCSTE
uniref:Elongation of very long chain fatty acids protein n=1 Tax=Cyprinus carpio TaxID=7962 RepID=A0A8C2FDR8_CYPCA